MKNRQRGITIIETVGALAIGSMLLVGLSAVIDSSLEDLKGQQAALQQSQVVNAARKYINDNYKQLTISTPTPATVVAIDVGTLRTQNYVPAGFSLLNAYNQTSCILVRQPVAGSGKLDALVVTSGGQRIEDRVIPAVAANAGQGSGYITEATPGTARGASWSLVTTAYRGVACPGGGGAVLNGAADGGHLASSLFYDGPGQLSTDFLYRNDVAGRPDLTTMNAPIRMNGAAVVAAGTSCVVPPGGPVAAIAVDASNNLLRCDKTNGRWTHVTTWKPPVANYAALAALSATDNVGDVRLALDKNRAFAYAGGNNWVALAVDEKGDLAVERDVNAGRDAVIGGDATVAGNVDAARDVNAGRDVTAGRDVNAGRNMNAANNITAADEVRGRNSVRGGYLQSDTYTETPELALGANKRAGDRCHIPVQVNGKTTFIQPIGTVVLDQNSLLLVCADDKRFRYPNGTFNP
jgi:type II secretory pathway pseudopilin PulG